MTATAPKRTGNYAVKHGMSRSREYYTWACMKDRCRNPKSGAYPHYGARGIKVCEAWLESFENFIRDMGRRPSPSHSIERINNDGDYCPENCRWATKREQNYNRTKSRWVTFKGETLCLAQWATRLGIRPGCVRHRLNTGWSVADALSTPSRSRKV